MNHELIKLHNNFPRFNLLHKDNESEKEILARVKKQGKQILERIKELKADNDHLFLSKEGTGSTERDLPEEELHQNATPKESEGSPTKPALEPTECTASGVSEERESCSDNLDIELEQGCNHCTLLIDQPCQIKEEDGVYINRYSGEILIFPTDESQDESLIQEQIIDQKIRFYEVRTISKKGSRGNCCYH